MAKSINQVILCGRLGSDPNVRTLDNGTKVCDFSLATGGEEYTSKDGREIKVPTQWHSIVCWRGLCELAEKALKKGSAVTVFGEINYRKYQDANGVDRYVTNIIATDLFLGGVSIGNTETNNSQTAGKGGENQAAQSDPFKPEQPMHQSQTPASPATYTPTRNPDLPF